MARTRKRSRKAAVVARSVPTRDWSRLIGEVTLIAVVVIVPLVMNPRSKSPLDVKDFVLGLAVMLGLSLVLLVSLARGRLEWASSRLNLLAGAFVAWSALTLLYSSYRYSTASELGRLLAHLGLFWLVILSIRDIAQVRRIIYAAAIAAVPVCIYGFVQVAGRDPISWSVKSTRVFSFLGNPTYLAGFLVLLLPLVVAVAWPLRADSAEGRRPIGRRLIIPLLLFLVAAIMLLCLYYSVSLSPAIGLAIGSGLALIIALSRSTRPTLARAIPVALVALALAAGLGWLGYTRLPLAQQRRVQQVVVHFKDPYGKERILLWHASADMFRSHPVFGTGYGTYRVASLAILARSWYSDLDKDTNRMLVPNYAHNEYLEVLSESGVIGGLLFGALLLALLYFALVVGFRHPDRAWGRIGLAVLAGTFAFLFQNFFGVTFRQPGVVTFFWLALGLLSVAAARLPAPGEDPLDEPRLHQLPLRPRIPASLLPIGGGLLLVVALLTWLMARPLEANVLVSRAERLAKRGDFALAADVADKAAKLNPWDARAYYVSAYTWGSLGDHERSLEANKRALALLPGNASVYYNMGVNYKELHRYDEAEQAFARAIELMPTAERHHAAMAELLIAEGRYKDAMPYALETIRLAPKDSRCYLLAADIQGRQGNLSATLDYLKQAGRYGRNDPKIWRQIAELSARLKRWDDAAAAARRWVALEPESAAASTRLAQYTFNLKQYPAARRTFKRALELDPNNTEARLGLAYTFLKLEDFRNAQKQLQYLVTNAPDSREAQVAAPLLAATAAASDAARRLRSTRPRGASGAARSRPR